MNKTNSIELPGGFEFLSPNGKTFPRFKKDSEDFGDKKRDVICGFSKSMKKTRQYILLSSSLFHKKYVYKYFDRREFASYIREKSFSLYFREIKDWDDPYEKRFYCADYSYFKEKTPFVNDHRTVYACCFTTKKDSEPSWQMYVNKDHASDSNKKDKGKMNRAVCVQARFDFKALLDYLNDYVRNTLHGEFMLVVRPVEYMNKNEINGLHHLDSEGNFKTKFFKAFDFSQYLNLLSLKRKAFIYEEEIRFFLIPKNKDCIIPTSFFINNERPKTPQNNNQGKVLNKIILDYRSEKEEIDYFRDRFQKLGLGDDDIVRSDLMEPFAPIIIGEKKEDFQKRMLGAQPH